MATHVLDLEYEVSRGTHNEQIAASGEAQNSSNMDYPRTVESALKKNTIKFIILAMVTASVWLACQAHVAFQEAEAVSPPKCYVFSTDGGVDVNRLNACLQGWYSWATTTGMGQYAGLAGANTFAGANKFTGGQASGPTAASLSSWTGTPGCIDVVGSSGVDAGYWQACVGSDGYLTLSPTKPNIYLTIQDGVDGGHMRSIVKGIATNRNTVRSSSPVAIPTDGDASTTVVSILPYEGLNYPPAMYVQGTFTGDAGASVLVVATWDDGTETGTAVHLDNVNSIYSLTGYDWVSIAYGTSSARYLKSLKALVDSASGPGSIDSLNFLVAGSQH